MHHPPPASNLAHPASSIQNRQPPNPDLSRPIPAYPESSRLIPTEIEERGCEPTATVPRRTTAAAHATQAARYGLLRDGVGRLLGRLGSQENPMSMLLGTTGRLKTPGKPPPLLHHRSISVSITQYRSVTPSFSGSAFEASSFRPPERICASKNSSDPRRLKPKRFSPMPTVTSGPTFLRNGKLCPQTLPLPAPLSRAIIHA